MRLILALFALRRRERRAFAYAAKAVSSPQLVIIDTDIGDDIDDAFALALALKSPELKVLGVTTTFGNTEMRARLVDRYLKAVGRSDIPVFAGPTTKTDNADDAGGLREAASGEEAFGDGAEFILRAAREHPGADHADRDRAAVHGAGSDQARSGSIQEAEARGNHGRQRIARLWTGCAGQAEAARAGVEHSDVIPPGEGVAGVGCAGIHDAAGFDPGAARCEEPRGDFCAWIAAHRPVDTALSRMDGRNAKPQPDADAV